MGFFETLTYPRKLDITYGLFPISKIFPFNSYFQSLEKTHCFDAIFKMLGGAIFEVIEVEYEILRLKNIKLNVKYQHNKGTKSKIRPNKKQPKVVLSLYL